MQKLKVIALLRQLNNRERKQLDNYMAAQFFYKRRECVTLYNYLKKFAPLYDKSTLTRETVFKAVFGDEPYQAQRILRTASELARNIEDCLAHIYMQENERTRRTALSKHYESQNNLAYLNTTINEWEQQNEQQNVLSLDYYQQAVAIFRFRMKANDTNEQHITALDHLNTALDTLFIIEKLHLYCQKLSNAQVFNNPIDIAFVEPIITYINNQPQLLDIPLVNLYYLPMQLLLQNERVLFEHFLSFLQTNNNKIEHTALRHAYVLAENICAINLRKGNTRYWQIIFDLYEQEIQHHIIYNPDGSMRIAVFKNIITVGLRLTKYEWTINFLNQNQMRLPEKERKDVYQYNLANIYFHQKNYEKVIDLLQIIQYTDISYKLSVRVLRLKTYYEIYLTNLTYIEVLEGEIAAFKVFIYRLNDISKTYKEQYRNFMLFFEKILHINTSIGKINQEKRKKLHEKISNTVSCAEKIWLLNHLK